MNRKDEPYDFAGWIFRQNLKNHRGMVVIQMPNRKRYVSRTTINGFLDGWHNRYTGQNFVCRISRSNKTKHVMEGGMRRIVVDGTEMRTYFGGFILNDDSPLSGDVYEVNAIKREGDTVLVRLGKRLRKAKRAFEFTLKEWKPKRAKVEATTVPQAFQLRIVG